MRETKPSLLDRMLNDIEELEANVGKLSPKVETLKHNAMCILPFWNSRHGKCKGFSLHEESDFYEDKMKNVGFDKLVDYMLELTTDSSVVYESSRFYYYANVDSYNWFECAKLVVANLSYVQSLETELMLRAKGAVGALARGLKILLGFTIWVKRRSVEDLEKRVELIHESILYSTRRAGGIFKTLIENREEMHDLINCLKDIDKSVLQSQKKYFADKRIWRLNLTDLCLVDRQTLCSLIADFNLSLKTVLELNRKITRDPSSSSHVTSVEEHVGQIRRELEFVTSIIEDGWPNTTYNAISTHVDVLVYEAYEKISEVFSCLSKVVSDMEAGEDDISKLYNENDRIRRVKDGIRMTDSYVLRTASTSIHNFLECLMEMVVDRELSNSSELRLLYTLVRDTENLLREHPHLEAKRVSMLSFFSLASYDLRSTCFRVPPINVIDPTTDPMHVCTNFLKDTLKKMPNANTLLLDIVGCFAKLPNADELLENLCRSLSEIEGEKLLLELLKSMLIHLMKLMDSDATTVVPVKPHVKTLVREVAVLEYIVRDLIRRFSEFGKQELVDLSRDVRAGVIEAARVYILFFRELDEESEHHGVQETETDEIPSYSSMVEAVERFKVSVRQANARFEKLYSSHSELAKLELEFYDMLINLTELIKRVDAKSAPCTSDQVKSIHDDLLICSSFLQHNAFKHDEREQVKQLRTQIMVVGRKVDSVINSLEEVPYWFSEMLMSDVSLEVHLIKEETTKFSATGALKTAVGYSDVKIENQKKKCETAKRSEFETHNALKPQEAMLGLGEEEVKLTRQVTTGAQKLEIMSIVGMPGLGKTTLAMYVFKGCAKSFHAHAWCYVGQNFDRKELLQQIIRQISERAVSELNRLGEEDLATLLKQSLRTKKNYLIVLDDIWDIKAWDELGICFPPGNSRSRILLTSRNKALAEEICGASNCLKLKHLTSDKSWQLLQRKVFGAGICPPELCKVGTEIAEKCGGLPLSIVVIAGVLKNIGQTELEWKQVPDTLDTHLMLNQDGVSSKLELSYRHLSVPMKQCFLYCGKFLRGKKIPRSKVVRMWLAERFIENADDQQKSLEVAAEKILTDLVDRSLLMLPERGSGNRIQFCRIHDLLRDFIIQKAEEEKFLMTTSSWIDSAAVQQRLCFSQNGDKILDFICSADSTPQISSLTFFGAVCKFQYTSYVSLGLEKFKLLTMLDMENITLDQVFCDSVARLKLLRYLAVRNSTNSISSSICELTNLETLIMRVIGGEVDVPDTIFNLSKLRYLLMSNRARVISDNRSSSCSGSLESFSTPALSGSTAKQIIAKFPNLRKLKCVFLDESMDFSHLVRLLHLESLKVLYYGLGRYQRKLSFPSNLRKLTLYKFRLPWSEIDNIAALLPQLEILKLLFKAVEGTRWDTSATFENLKYLRVEEINVREWKASEDNFPALERLVVRRCKQLQSIPREFSKIGEMSSIEIHWCNPVVAKSALKIKRKQIDDGNMQFETVTYPTMLDLSDDDEDDDDDDDE